jgi:hypothetical protein
MADVWGAEIADFVLNPDGTVLERRQQNAAANEELVRRNPATQSDRWGTVQRSGEAAPYAIAWVNTVTGETVIEPGTGDVIEAYGLALFGMLAYGGLEP